MPACTWPRAERAAAALAARLGLAGGATVFHTLIVHYENGVPLQCEDRYVNPACAPGYLSVDFTRTTPTHYLLAGRAAVGGAVFDRGQPADARRKRGCSASPATSPAWWWCAAPSASGVPITWRAWCTPASRYQIDGQFKP